MLDTVSSLGKSCSNAFPTLDIVRSQIKSHPNVFPMLDTMSFQKILFELIYPIQMNFKQNYVRMDLNLVSNGF